MTVYAISVIIKHFFVRLNSAVFKVFICENIKLPFSCLKHPSFQHLHKNKKWTAMRHSQMVNVAKHALSSKVFSLLFTQAWKLLPGYFLFLLSIHGICTTRKIWGQDMFSIHSNGNVLCIWHRIYRSIYRQVRDFLVEGVTPLSTSLQSDVACAW